jgi:hypothetical protein
MDVGPADKARDGSRLTLIHESSVFQLELVSPSVAKCLLGPEVTSADAGNGPDKTSPNAVREISFQCKKGLMF